MFTNVPMPDSSYDADEAEDVDPLEQELLRRQPRTTQFDDGFGDIGLAGSIFRLLGTPTTNNWPVCSSTYHTSGVLM